MIPKGGNRLSEKIMLKQIDRAHPDTIGMGFRAIPGKV
jgi:hypothetical protein